MLDLPDWKKTEHTNTGVPNMRLTIWERGTSRIEMARHWDHPLIPGRPMYTASVRKVIVAGHSEELHTTSMFEGAAMEVGVLFLQGAGWAVRIVFDGCSLHDVDEVCSRIVIVP